MRENINQTLEAGQPAVHQGAEKTGASEAAPLRPGCAVQACLGAACGGGPAGKAAVLHALNIARKAAHSVWGKTPTGSIAEAVAGVLDDVLEEIVSSFGETSE